jgi:hypothetical protein
MWGNGTHLLQRLLIALTLIGIAFTMYSSNNHLKIQMNEILEIEDSGWCENNDLSWTENGPEVTGQGWPCVMVFDVRNVSIRDSQFCGYITLGLEQGGPGMEIYQMDWSSICSNKELGSNGFKNAVYENLVKPKLNSLVEKLCSNSLRAEVLGYREKCF